MCVSCSERFSESGHADVGAQVLLKAARYMYMCINVLLMYY